MEDSCVVCTWDNDTRSFTIISRNLHKGMFESSTYFCGEPRKLAGRDISAKCVVAYKTSNGAEQQAAFVSVDGIGAIFAKAAQKTEILAIGMALAIDARLTVGRPHAVLHSTCQSDRLCRSGNAAQIAPSRTLNPSEVSVQGYHQYIHFHQSTPYCLTADPRPQLERSSGKCSPQSDIQGCQDWPKAAYQGSGQDGQISDPASSSQRIENPRNNHTLPPPHAHQQHIFAFCFKIRSGPAHSCQALTRADV